MSIIWTRTSTIAPVFHLNRNARAAGLWNKTSSEVMPPIGVDYHTKRLNCMYRLKDLDAQNYHYHQHHLGYLICGVRDYSDKTPGSVPPSPPPTPPTLPDRAQVERALFRVIAFFWDYGLWLFAWSRKMIKLHVIEKPIVKFYWKRFHEKMEEAKKDT